MFDLVGMFGCIFFVWCKNFKEWLYVVWVWIFGVRWCMVLILWFRILGWVFINVFRLL